MPQGWIEPELVVQVGDVGVWHTYKDDYFDSGCRQYGYTVSEACGEDSCTCDLQTDCQIDIRDLATWDGGNAAETFKRAIKSGALTAEGIQEEKN